MELKILDSIIHGVLKPWNLDTTNTRRFTELVKAAKNISPENSTLLISQLNLLLADYPSLKKVLLNEKFEKEIKLKDLLFKNDLPKYKDSITQLYYLIIAAETLHILNIFLERSEKWTELIDIRYQVKKILNNIKVLTQQTAAELNERDFTYIPNEESSYIHFALYYLKHKLINLYFSIQEIFKSNLTQITTLEDFYLLDLQEPLSKLQRLDLIDLDLEKGNNDINEQKFSFGFRGNKENLKMILGQLCLKIGLLNEKKSTIDELVEVFTTKNLLLNSIKIYINCETVQFRYIIDCISLNFSNLKLSTIEKSGVFFSKKGTLITAQNLSAGKVENPKEKDKIDNIIKHL